MSSRLGDENSLLCVDAGTSPAIGQLQRVAMMNIGGIGCCLRVEGLKAARFSLLIFATVVARIGKLTSAWKVISTKDAF